MTLRAQSLIPSELVYFNAEKLVSTKGVFNKISLMHTDVQVNRVELAQHLLAAAFLSCWLAASVSATWLSVTIYIAAAVVAGIGFLMTFRDYSPSSRRPRHR